MLQQLSTEASGETGVPDGQQTHAPAEHRSLAHSESAMHGAPASSPEHSPKESHEPDAHSGPWLQSAPAGRRFEHVRVARSHVPEQQLASAAQAVPETAQQKVSCPCAGGGHESPWSHDAVTLPSTEHVDPSVPGAPLSTTEPASE